MTLAQSAAANLNGRPERENCGVGVVPLAAGSISAEKVIVPEAQTMTRFLFKNCKWELYQYLNHCARDGSLSWIVGFPVLTRVFNSRNCTFSHVTFWRLGQKEFIADIDVMLTLEARGCGREWEGCLTLNCGFWDEFEYHIEGLYPWNRKPNREGDTMLSPFLIPYYKNYEVDREAEQIWKDYIPKAVNDVSARDAMKLADRMGLTVQFHPVYAHQGTDSILFFEEGPLLIKDEFSVSKEEPKELIIPADTIVVNTNRIKQDYSFFNIYHECFHYEEHYLFYCLQDMYSNDVRNVQTKEVTLKEGQTVTDPIYWIEKQANRGAFGLMMPRSSTEQLIREELRRATGWRHAGEKYETVGKALSRKLHLPHFRVRARMIQLGHIEARGALNYVDRRLIRPFAFASDSWRSETMTFVVDRATAGALYEKSEEFRKVMDTGKFVYADGHIVRNEPRFIEMTPGGARLSPWAGAHVDMCCLRFRRSYIQKNVGEYEFGRMHYDADYARQTMFYLEDMINEKHMDELAAEEEYRKNFPATFEEAFDLVMHRNGLTREKMAEKLNMETRTLDRWLGEPRKRISQDFVIMTMLILRLPDWITELLFDRAHEHLSREDPRDRALMFIMRAMWMDGIEKANEYLKNKGFEALSL